MSTRLLLQKIIDTNVYDNNNKEILASMMRTVLEALMNSDYNKDDDQLQNLKYNATKTLAQQFASVPIIKTARIGPFDVGGSGSVNETVEGEAVDCLNNKLGGRSELTITFPLALDIINKKFFFTYYMANPTGNRPDLNDSIGTPVYGFLSTTQMLVVIREFESVSQDFYLDITII